MSLKQLLFAGALAAQVLGVAFLSLCGYWVGKFGGGFGWDKSHPSTVFNYHPFFMALGLIFLNGNAILVYRLFPNTAKLYVKILHAALQILALVFATIALVAVFNSHNWPTTPKPNLYSFHSWLGLTTFILFGLQWVVGFVSFLFPKIREQMRSSLMPFHRFFGVFIFGMCAATAFVGINEKAGFDSAIHNDEGNVLNSFGMLILGFTVLITGLVTVPSFARPSS